MIDDEADNASINTNDPETDPTKTNTFLRDILSTFAKSSYVGYTATPFANIFINPDVTHSRVGADLFPRDFIYWLDAPSSYFGSDKVFIDDEYSSRILMEIDDAENYIPLSHKKYFDFPGRLPPSLYQAINVFIVARAIRELRGQGREHASMLVNISRFTDVQREAKNLISSHIQNIEDAVRLNYKLPDNEALKNEQVAGLYEACQSFVAGTEDSSLSVLWGDLKAVLFKVVASIDLLLINSRSDDVLNYSDYKDGRTVIAVGGISLSRGLTLEGLCTSYMYRNTRMYDTLMQMGRWFGYRDGYEDLCTVWLNGQSINWYHHITVATDDLRQQVVHMRQRRCSPKDFGLYIRKSADNLLITAPGKMKSGTDFVMRWNFSGKLKESYLLPKSEVINRVNRDLIKKYFDTGFGMGADKCEPALLKDGRKSKGRFIKDVPVQSLIFFLKQFTVCDSLEVDKTATMAFLELISPEYPFSDVLFISVEDNEASYRDIFPLGYQLRPSVKDDSTGTTWKLAKNRVASRNDEKLGLTEEQIKEVEEGAGGSPLSDRDYRAVRNKPLLMLHLINCIEGSTDLEKMAPAYGVSFPFGDFDKTVEITVNPVWLRQHNEDFGDPDDEVGDE